MKEWIKKCPFCGTEVDAVRIACDGTGTITCYECAVVFKFLSADTLDEVMEIWNKREEKKE